MTDEHFEKIKAELIDKKSEKPFHLKQLSGKYLYEIEERTYNFNRADEEIKEAKGVKKTDVLAVYKVRLFRYTKSKTADEVHIIVMFVYQQHLDSSAAGRNKLAVHVIHESTPVSSVPFSPGVCKTSSFLRSKSER